jgi:prepilin-type N-terminal cleavage/methylation domain-containing protein
VRTTVSRSRDDAGFTLVEVLVASIVLAVGIVAAFTMLDTAGRTAATNNARTAASNLAREISEYARGTDYDLLRPSTMVGALRDHPRIAGTNNWKIERRGMTYKIKAEVCTFDDPKDGLSIADPPNPCTPKAAAVAGAPVEVNPDDFRRVTLELKWDDRQGEHTLTQTALIVNPSGGLGPRIMSFPEPTAQITSGTFVSWAAATNPVVSDPADAIVWTVDDGVSQGDLSGSSTTSWAFTWNVGTLGTAPFTTDGTYQVSAQAFDSRGVPGESRSVTVHLNRRIPYAPTNVVIGRNDQHGGVVDLDWSRNQERDVLGYRVYRVGLLGSRTQICSDADLTYTVKTSCTDQNPNGLTLPVGLPNYVVVAVDRTDLKADASAIRDGTENGVGLPTKSARPDEPVASTPTIVDGLPVVTWTEPSVDTGAGQRPIRLYRIYRDNGVGGIDLDDRYDVTVDASTTWTDPKPGNSTAHDYYVTAVDDRNNESNLSNRVTSP